MSEFFQAHPMLLFGLEAAVALFLLIFIVVWTMGTAKKNPRPSRAPADHPSRRQESATEQNAVSSPDQTAQETHKQDSRPAP
jgi:predicted lipid-binding transport protein (Tim44 family)